MNSPLPSGAHRIASSPRVVHLSSYENADLSQSRESLEAAARLFDYEPVFDHQLYFTSSPTEAEKTRRQRDAVAMLLSASQTLQQAVQDSSHRLQLLVTNQDIFSSKMNFAYGLANPELGIAVMSTFRLTRWAEELTPSQIQERVLKEAAHEIGHLVGLAHCENFRCLMSFSKDLEQVDSKLPLLCNVCSSKPGLRII